MVHRDRKCFYKKRNFKNPQIKSYYIDVFSGRTALKQIRAKFVLKPKLIWDKQYIGSQKHQVLFLIFLKIDFVALSLTIFKKTSFSGQMRVMVPTT